MVMDIDGAAVRERLPEPIRWLGRLRTLWEDQRAEAALPAADELFLADMAELVPNLVLASRDEETELFRVEFAGASAKDLLALDPVGTIPEHEPIEHPVAWLGAGFLRVRRPAVPGPHWLRRGDIVGLFMPYGAFDGRVTLILAGIARWPAVIGVVNPDGRVMPVPDDGGRRRGSRG